MSYYQKQDIKSFDGVKIAYTDEGKGLFFLLIHWMVLLTLAILGVKQN